MIELLTAPILDTDCGEPPEERHEKYAFSGSVESFRGNPRKFKLELKYYKNFP